MSPHEQWIALSVAVILFIVRILKSEKTPPPFNRITPKGRAVVALVLGEMSGVLSAAVLPGQTLGTALKGGLAAAAISVLSHDVVIEWLLQGRELLQTKPPIQVRPEERVPPGTPTDPGRPV